MTTGSGVALATQGLAKRYGSRVALDGLDLRVPEGVVYGFLGPNGAGKTTTMRILTGLVRPDAGRVELLGCPFGRGDRRRLFEVGALMVIGQQSCLLSAGTRHRGVRRRWGGPSAAGGGGRARDCTRASRGIVLGDDQVPGGDPPEECDRVPAGGDGCSVVGPVCDRVATWGSAEVCQRCFGPGDMPDGPFEGGGMVSDTSRAHRNASIDGGRWA